MAVLTYEDLKDSVENISRRYARNCSMDQEDMEQEIWLHIYSFEKMPETIEFARTMMINKAIDLSRKTWRNDNRSVVVDFHQNSNDDDPGTSDDCFVYANETEENHDEDGYASVDSEINLRKMIGTLNDRERKYVVSKAYLSCGIEFLENDFFEIIKDLSSEAKESLLSSQRGDSDDTILKLVLGIKTGTNSGTIRAIKASLRNKLACIMGAMA